MWPRVIFSILVDNRRIEDNLDGGGGLADLRWEHSLDMPLVICGRLWQRAPLDHLARVFSRIIFSRTSRSALAHGLRGSFTLTYRANANANINLVSLLFFIARSATILQQMVRTIALYKQLHRDYGSNNSCLLRSLLSRVSYIHWDIHICIFVPFIIFITYNKVFQG